MVLVFWLRDVYASIAVFGGDQSFLRELEMVTKSVQGFNAALADLRSNHDEVRLTIKW